jgi:hypothetical protein
MLKTDRLGGGDQASRSAVHRRNLGRNLAIEPSPMHARFSATP